MIFFHSLVAFKKNVHLCAAKGKLGKESQKEYRFFSLYRYKDLQEFSSFVFLCPFLHASQKNRDYFNNNKLKKDGTTSNQKTGVCLSNN